MEVPVEKTAFVGQIRRPAFAREAEAIAFGEFLGRRRDRAALADSLVKTVTGSLRQQRRKGGRFKKALRQEVRRVGLRIDEGTRTLPVAVGVHVICHEEPSSRVKEVFEEWWDTARAEAGAEKITLLPNSFHDARAMPLDIYDNLVKLELG
jgi:hypothetical protein